MDQGYLHAVADFHKSMAGSCTKAAASHTKMHKFHKAKADNLDDGDANKAVHSTSAEFHKTEADRHTEMAEAHHAMAEAAGNAGPDMERGLIPDHVRAILPTDGPRDFGHHLVFRTGGAPTGVDLTSVPPEFRDLCAVPED